MVEQDGEPLFVAKDLADILGYSNAEKALRLLEDDEKRGSRIGTSGGKQWARCVTESGMWCLVIKSNKPEAVKIRKWVTSQVLPSIRKTGGYGMPVPVIIGFKKYYRYDWWLLTNGYSVMSGSVRERIRKHPHHFAKDRENKWCIEEDYSGLLKDYRAVQLKLNFLHDVAEFESHNKKLD